MLCTVIFLSGCTLSRIDHGTPGGESGSDRTSYATGFRILEKGESKLIEVYDPWQNSRDLTFTYMLAENRGSVPDSLSALPFIRIPIRRAITLSTTHVAMIHAIGKLETIVGASGTGFIFDEEVRERVERGSIVEVGYDMGLNYEAIVDLDPDVLFMYGVESSVRATADKLSELGVPVVFCGEYLETHPLGKCEWIRFFSSFYGIEQEGDRIFRTVDSNYCSLARMVAGNLDKPRVFMGLPWNDAWFVAGGQSYAARLVEDAGGLYIWSDKPSTEALPMDLESVYSRAVDADIWVNPGAARSLQELIRFDERFGSLEAVTNGLVYNNDLRLNGAGGNDYWESGTVRPDLILADLIAIFHPDLMREHQFYFYRQLK